MKVRLTQAAQEDLSSIARWIARDRPKAAKRIATGLRAACLDLSHNPQAYAAAEDSRHKGMRRRPYSRYLIYYRVELDHVVVTAILDGARDGVERL